MPQHVLQRAGSCQHLGCTRSLLHLFNFVHNTLPPAAVPSADFAQPAPSCSTAGRGVVHRLQAVRVGGPGHLPNRGHLRAFSRVCSGEQAGFACDRLEGAAGCWRGLRAPARGLHCARWGWRLCSALKSGHHHFCHMLPHHPQWLDKEDNIQAAIEACPVSCIHWVNKEDLPALEFVCQNKVRRGLAPSLA